MSKMTKIVVAVAAVVVLGGIGLWYFVLRDTAPDAATLDAIDVPRPQGPRGRPVGSAERQCVAGRLDGTWTVVTGEDVFVGYRIEELFGGQTIEEDGHRAHARGHRHRRHRRHDRPSATFTADVTKLASDEARRDGAVGSRGLQTETFPEATFTLTAPIDLPGTGAWTRRSRSAPPAT